MAWTTELDELMTGNITLKPLASFDAYGEPTYSTAGVSIPARIVWQPHRVSDWSGDERIAQAQVVLATTRDIKVTDQITLPNGETPAIIHIREVPWVDGDTHHFALSLGGQHERKNVGWS